MPPNGTVRKYAERGEGGAAAPPGTRPRRAPVLEYVPHGIAPYATLFLIPGSVICGTRRRTRRHHEIRHRHYGR